MLNCFVGLLVSWRVVVGARVFSISKKVRFQIGLQQHWEEVRHAGVLIDFMSLNPADFIFAFVLKPCLEYRTAANMSTASGITTRALGTPLNAT